MASPCLEHNQNSQKLRKRLQQNGAEWYSDVLPTCKICFLASWSVSTALVRT